MNERQPYQYYLWRFFAEGAPPPLLVRVRVFTDQLAEILRPGGRWEESEAADRGIYLGEVAAVQIPPQQAAQIEAYYLAAQATA